MSEDVYADLFERELDHDFDPEELWSPTYAGRKKDASGADVLFSWLGIGVKSTATKEEEEEEKGLLEFVVSTGTPDRMGDSIDQNSWRLKHYLKNPVFLRDHDSRLVVGAARKVWRVKDEETKKVKELRKRIRMDESEKNPDGVLIAHQHRNGFRRAVSVSFFPKEAINRTKLPSDDPLYVDPKTVEWSFLAGYVYRENDLLETSSVGVPANPEALQASYELWRAEDKEEAVSRYLGDTVERRVKELLLSSMQDDPEVKRRLLALMLGERPSTPPATSKGKSWEDMYPGLIGERQ